MVKRPIVSVVIPTYNRAKMICATIDNVLEQTYRDFELIIVDDGSTDDTLSTLRTYGDRIRVISQANAGPAVARNRGAEAARGEIIAFQDSDDLWKPTKLERQVSLLERLGPSVPCCLCNVRMRVVEGKDVTSFDVSLIHPEHAEGLWLNVPEVLATRFLIFNQAAAIRRDVFERVGGFDTSLKYLEDYDLPLRLSLEGPWAFIREPLVIYGEDSPESFSQRALKDQVTLKECELRIIHRVLGKVDGGTQQANLRRLLKQRLRVFRRGMMELNVTRMGFWGAQYLAGFLKLIGRSHDALIRRLPGFPKAITVPADARKLSQGKGEYQPLTR
jgi:glycosyltransferase involved in cell wall biosynthesis